MGNDALKIKIFMPNEILIDMKEWLEDGTLKSSHHQEFVYSYYFLLSYLWRYAIYSEEKFTQSKIKQFLGYNPTEKRINYIIKENGLLDSRNYTLATKDFPVSWTMDNSEGLSFKMLEEYDLDDQRDLLKFKSNNYIVKEPLKHTGASEEEGCYWSIENTHMVDKSIFDFCLSHKEDLGLPAFYLYGVLSFIKDKNKAKGERILLCSNETLMIYTGWKIRKVIKYTNNLSDYGLIMKKQPAKRKGAVNHYQL